MLETLVHFPLRVPNFNFNLSEIFFPDDFAVEVVKSSDLPDNWEKKEFASLLHGIGKKWIEKGDSPVLKVPSGIVHEEYNFLFNPEHPLFSKIKITNVRPFKYDPRLK